MKSRSKQPVSGGIRRRRTSAPAMSRGGDATIVKYSTLGNTLSTASTTGGAGDVRFYMPGLRTGITNPIGPDIVSSYSEGKFLPSTHIRWEPSVSFTVSGRVLCGFTDNPEVIVSLNTLLATFVTTPTAGNLTAYLDGIRGLGTMRSFPVWQETDVPFPTRTRRKMFDTNANIGSFDVNLVDRTAQTAFFVGVEGGPTTATPLGSFHYTDHVRVEGIHGVIT